MSGIAVVVTTDGRGEYLGQSIPSWEAASGSFVSRTILDDSGSGEYRGWLRSEYGGNGWSIAHVGASRQGYGEAMRRMREIGVSSGADYILHVEDDFVLNGPLSIDDIAGVMDESEGRLAQMALLRQPWYANEVEHGGVIQALQAQGCHFDQRTNGTHHWIEHRAVWTANPNLMPADVARIPYPACEWSESAFMKLLREMTTRACAYWGRFDDEPAVTHIGRARLGTGY